MIYTLYLHKNKINGKVYIGQTCLSLEERSDHGKGYQNCRYFYITIYPIDVMFDTTTKHEIVFDLKYNVPVIECEITKTDNSVLSFSDECTYMDMTFQRTSNDIVDSKGNAYYTVCYHLTENELFKIFTLNEYYNPDMVKTYKRYIKLRGE